MSRPAAPGSPVLPVPLLRRWARGVRWYARQLSGESKWDDHLARCAAEGTTPMSRREFERHRADHLENRPQGRCC